MPEKTGPAGLAGAPGKRTAADTMGWEEKNMTAQSQKKLSKFTVWLSIGAFAASILLFWLGLDLLKTEVFPHYYNAGKHVIVQQNPDTREGYGWKDSQGNTYTPEDSQVKNFTWGTTALILLVMAFGVGVYKVSVSYYTRVLLESDPGRREGCLPELQ